MARHHYLTLVVSLGLVAGAAAGWPAAAAPAPDVSAKPAVDGTFPVDGSPTRIVAGPDGNVWFGVSGNSGSNDLARITPAGAITYYDLGAVNVGTLVVGPDKNLWATIDTGVAKIPVADPTTVTAYDITGFAAPGGIAVGPDKSLWAAGGDKMYRVSLANPAGATPFSVPGMAAKQVAATASRVWVVDFNGKIHAFKTDGTFTTTTVGGNPQGIAGGPQDQVLYSNPENQANHAARLTVGGTPQKTPLPGTDPSFSVASGADGAYWVGLFLTRKIARITADGMLTEYGTWPAPFRPRYVAAGPGATIWVSLEDPGNDGAIGRVTGLDVDKTATIKVKGATATVAKGRAAVRLKCPTAEVSGPCTGSVTLKSLTGKKAKLGKKTYSIRTGKTKAVKVALSGVTIGRNGLKVLAVVKVKDAAGNKKTVKKQIRLVR